MSVKSIALLLQKSQFTFTRSLLVISLVVSPLFAAWPVHATTVFSNDYPDMNAVDCHNQFGSSSWCKDLNSDGDFNDPYEYDSPRGYVYRNCTDGAAYWVKKYTGVVISVSWGNAYNWDNAAPANQVYDGTTNNIEPGDIAQSEDGGAGNGHVGFVTSVTKNADGTVASFATAELNKHDDGNYTGPGAQETNVYSSRNAANKFIRNNSSGYDWDHFIDVNGLGFGLNNESLGGSISGGEGGGDAASWASGRLDIFARGTNATGPNVYQKRFDGAWQDWVMPGGDGARVSSSPAAVSWAAGRIDVFGRSEAGNLLHKSFDQTTGWSNWENMGGCIIDSPSVSSWAPGRLDIFAQGCNSTGPNLYHKVYNGTWLDWELVPGFTTRIAGGPSATSWGPNRIDIFARGQAGDLLHSWYGGSPAGWGGWESFGGCIDGNPAVSSWGDSRLDVFVKGCNATGPNLIQKTFDGTWHDWVLVPGTDGVAVSAVLGAVSWGPNRIDIFARGQAGDLAHKWYDGTWSNWESQGGGITP